MDTLSLSLSQTVEKFLVEEAALLDTWRLREWAELFADTGRYVVISGELDPDIAAEVDPNEVLCLINDDLSLLHARVDRLENTRAHAENPRSRVRHFVTNLSVEYLDDAEGPGRYVATSNVLVTRCRRERLNKIDQYVGFCRHTLTLQEGCSNAAVEGRFKILERRVVLDLEWTDAIAFIL